MRHLIFWQLSNPGARGRIDLKAFGPQLKAEIGAFNAQCKSGSAAILWIGSHGLLLTYDCAVKLKKPGAALHAFSQGLVDGCPAFRGMLAGTDPARLFQSVV